jgi:hypothetical protein
VCSVAILVTLAPGRIHECGRRFRRHAGWLPPELPRSVFTTIGRSCIVAWGRPPPRTGVADEDDAVSRVETPMMSRLLNECPTPLAPKQSVRGPAPPPDLDESPQPSAPPPRAGSMRRRSPDCARFRRAGESEDGAVNRRFNSWRLGGNHSPAKTAPRSQRSESNRDPDPPCFPQHQGTMVSFSRVTSRTTSVATQDAVAARSRVQTADRTARIRPRAASRLLTLSYSSARMSVTPSWRARCARARPNGGPWPPRCSSPAPRSQCRAMPQFRSRNSATRRKAGPCMRVAGCIGRSKESRYRCALSARQGGGAVSWLCEPRALDGCSVLLLGNPRRAL